MIFIHYTIRLIHYTIRLIHYVNEKHMRTLQSREIRIRRRKSDIEPTLLMSAFARIDSVAMAVAMGLVFGIGLFLATAILLIKGGGPGVPVGPNLSALVTFLPGYSVSWVGSVVGALYAAAVGAVVGCVLSVMWNVTHFIFIGIVVMRASWFD